MSQAYHGTPTFVTSAGASVAVHLSGGRGTLVAVQVNFANPQPGYCSIIDSNVSTTTGGKKLFEATLHSASTVLNYNFLPPLPVAYTAGLFINASGTQSVIVNYLPFQRNVP